MNIKYLKSINWREWIITPTVELLLLGLSVLATFKINERASLTFFVGLFVFYSILFFATIIFMAVIRCFSFFRRGIYSYENNPWLFYSWRLHEFLCETNLSLFYLNSLLPPLFRKYFYRLLGAKINRGFTSVCGRILSPYMVQIGSQVRIGDEVLLMPYTYAIGSTDILVLDEIEIGDRVVIEPRATILPGVIIGENSMVQAMTVVSMNTKIPPNEIWGGVPAKKVADVDLGNWPDSNISL